MSTLLVTHPVHDVDAWRAAFEAGDGLRARHGATEVRVFRDGDRMVGILDFADDAALQAFLADEELRAPVGGGAGRPEARVVTEVEHRRY